MSDEDRDVDVESDEDDDGSICLDSPGAQASGPYFSQAEKRAHHNALERKRRDHIKESFHSLRDSVPALEGEKVSDSPEQRREDKGMSSKVSRAQILKKAADYIQFMRRKNHSHQQDIEDLKKQNNMLEQQIRSLEKAKSTGTFANQSGAVNLRGGQVSAFDGGSESESSDLEDKSAGTRRKKLKTAPS